MVPNTIKIFVRNIGWGTVLDFGIKYCLTEIHNFEHAITALARTFSIHFAFLCFDFARFYFYQTYVFYSDYKANIVAILYKYTFLNV
jgi:hypothetical protein